MTEHQFTELAYERRGPTGWITLDRPARRNALSPTMVRELLGVLDLASGDSELRFLVITGAGATFCAGADLSYVRQVMDIDGGLERFIDELLEPLVEFISRLREAPYPVIAAVNGPCVAGGLRIVLSCDIVVASTEASFAEMYPTDSIVPAVGEAAGLVRSIGANLSERLVLVPESPPIRPIANFGLISDLVEPSALVKRVEWLTGQLSTRTPASLKALKAAVDRRGDRSWV
jgi:2-(1,2-epoxy-1,2-dihydrophenyl)acetyl-CoA isomerase